MQALTQLVTKKQRQRSTSRSKQQFVSHHLGGTSFDLPKRYRPKRLIGQGSYGSVISALDSKTMQTVAIKKLPLIEDTVSLLLYWAVRLHSE